MGATAVEDDDGFLKLSKNPSKSRSKLGNDFGGAVMVVVAVGSSNVLLVVFCSLLIEVV